MAWPPDKWMEVEADPRFQKLAPELQMRARHDWARDRFVSSRSQDPEVYKKLVAEAFAGMGQTGPSFLEKAGSTAWDVLERTGKVLNTPQQMISGMWKKSMAGWEPGETVTSTVKEAAGDVARAVNPWAKQRPERYEYDWYADPMLVASIPGAAKWVGRQVLKRSPTLAKGAKAVAESVSQTAKKFRPPEPLPRGGFEAKGLGTERVFKPAEEGGKIVGEATSVGEVPPLSTVGPPKKQIPTFGDVPATKTMGGPNPIRQEKGIQALYRQRYLNALKEPELMRNFNPDEIKQVAEFVARNPDDLISQYIKQGGSLAREAKPGTGVTWNDVVNHRIFGKPIGRPEDILLRTEGRVRPPVKKEVKPQVTKPVEVNPVEQLNVTSPTVEPLTQAEVIENYLRSTPKP